MKIEIKNRWTNKIIFSTETESSEKRVALGEAVEQAVNALIPLDNADLSGAYVGIKNLKGIIARNTNFDGADFSGTNLQNAIFDGASLSGATFDEANLEGATFNGEEIGPRPIVITGPFSEEGFYSEVYVFKNKAIIDGKIVDKNKIISLLKVLVA